MVLLAAVTLVSLAIAGGASLVGSADTAPARIAEGLPGHIKRTPAPDERMIHVSGQPVVRVVGAPFVPNTNPRER